MTPLATPSTPPVLETDPAARALRRFRQIFTAARTHFQQVERQVGLGGAQVWALGVIAAQPGRGVGALALSMQVHQSTASNLVRALVQRELVGTERDPRDKRVVRLHPTAAGTALLARVPGPFTGLLPVALARLDPALLGRLDEDLTALLRAMGVDENAPALPIAQV